MKTYKQLEAENAELQRKLAIAEGLVAVIEAYVEQVQENYDGYDTGSEGKEESSRDT